MSEHFTEARVGLPQDYVPTAEAKKTPPTEQVEDAPVNKQEPTSTPITSMEDDVVADICGNRRPQLVTCGLVACEI